MKTLVLLVNFGTPRGVDDVPRFLKAMTGRDAPPPVVAAVSDRYRAIGGISPLAAITDEQATLLAQKTGNRFPVLPVYRYSHPTIAERLDEALQGDFERLLFLVMSPYYAPFTTGQYMAAVEDHLKGLPSAPKVIFVQGWHEEPSFLDCWVSRMESEGFGTGGPHGGSFYVFSAHSLPLSASEPYRHQVEETVRAVAERLGLRDNYAVAWQSVAQGASEPWIGPPVEEVLEGLAGKVPAVVEVPIGFVSDHLETKYDMDVVHRECARALGLGFFRVPSLNAYGPFVSALATILEKALGEPA